MEHFVAKFSQMEDPSVQVVHVGDQEIGVFRCQDHIYAYRNECLHQGGPVCEGTLIPKVEAVLRDDQTVAGEQFSPSEWHIVCPWHGYEYGIATGQCAPNPALRLTPFTTIIRGDDIYLSID